MLTNTEHFTNIIDAPCGSGKTHRLLTSLRPDRKYLLVTPRLTEVNRFCDLHETDGQNAQTGETWKAGDELPEDRKLHPALKVLAPRDQARTLTQRGYNKTENLKQLLAMGQNVACTHSLYDNLKDAVDGDLLGGYDVVIDEVPDPITVKSGVSARKLNDLLIGQEYAVIEMITNQLRPTAKWDSLLEQHKNRKTGELNSVNMVEPELYEEAQNGKLIAYDDNLFLVATPVEVLLGGRSLTILTYKSEGSYMINYLRKLSKDFPKATPHVELWNDREFLQKARELVHIENLEVADVGTLGFESQEKMTLAQSKRLGSAMKKRYYKDRDQGLAPIQDNVAVVCSKAKWHAPKGGAGPVAKEARLYRGSNFISSKTRGINTFDHVTYMFYCYSMHPHPRIADFLGVNTKTFSKEFALAEAIQVIWRMAQRRHKDPEKVTIVFASKRMRTIFEEWLHSIDDVSLSEVA